jgi:hypothetical protein
MYLTVKANATKKNAGFDGTNLVELFNLKPPMAAGENPFEECEFAKQVTDIEGHLGTFEGETERLTSRNDSKSETFTSKRGRLVSIQCKVQNIDDSFAKLGCGFPRMTPFSVKLVSKLDLAAQAWAEPRMKRKAPRLGG